MSIRTPKSEVVHPLTRAPVFSSSRLFLFLQGPHGPFFRRLASALQANRHMVCKVALNASDESEWRRQGPLFRYNGLGKDFAEWLDETVTETDATDIVLYGETRLPHSEALKVARRRGLKTHIFEEGYLRPSWITYELEGTNAASPIMRFTTGDILQFSYDSPRKISDTDALPAAVWGDSRQHQWFSFLYHLRLLLPSLYFPHYRGHRSEPLWKEAAWYTSRVLRSPITWIVRSFRTARLLQSRPVFHLVLLQLSFDSAMRAHSRFQNNREFVSECIAAFVIGARQNQRLVFKAHPFEDGREGLGKHIRAAAVAHGIADRVDFIDGGVRLGSLLDAAISVVTINSTGGQQALWRGKPVITLGDAVYGKEGLVSEQRLSAFFSRPDPPVPAVYDAFRHVLLSTSQIPGSFYSKAGIEELTARLPKLMSMAEDPYRGSFAIVQDHSYSHAAE